MKYSFTMDEIANYVKIGAQAEGKLPKDTKFKVHFLVNNSPSKESFFEDIFGEIFGKSAPQSKPNIKVNVEFEPLE